MTQKIEELLEQQRQVRAQRAQVQKDLKNAQRRRARLKHKARLLSASDLASVLVMRREEEETKAKASKRQRQSSQPGLKGEEDPRDGRTEEQPREREEDDATSEVDVGETEASDAQT